MNNLNIITKESNIFGQVRFVVLNGKEYAVGKDVAKALGYKNTNDAIRTKCKGVVKHDGLKTNGIEMALIPESDIYRLIFGSKLPNAEKFQDWIFDDVLPTIRKTGGYVSNDDMFINTYLPFADETTKALFKSTLEVTRKQNEIIQKQNKTINTFKESENSILVREFCKVISKKGFTIGEKRMWQFLKDNKYVNQNREPYQKYIEMGLFEVKEGTKNNHTYRTTKVTGKGQVYFIEKIKAI